MQKVLAAASYFRGGKQRWLACFSACFCTSWLYAVGSANAVSSPPAPIILPDSPTPIERAAASAVVGPPNERALNLGLGVMEMRFNLGQEYEVSGARDRVGTCMTCKPNTSMALTARSLISTCACSVCICSVCPCVMK